jgi:speckle-type POZ protein
MISTILSRLFGKANQEKTLKDHLAQSDEILSKTNESSDARSSSGESASVPEVLYTQDEPVGIAIPPPKRQKLSRSIETAEDYCVTDANWKEIQYTWTINNFAKCQDELGHYMSSPDFPSYPRPIERDMAFHLKVHLKGENDDSRDHLAVYLVCKGIDEVLASFELSIMVDSSSKMNTRDSKKVCQFSEDHHPAWGFKKFIKLDELQNKNEDFLRGDCLTLHCEVKYVICKNLKPIHQNRGEVTFKPESRVEEGMERLDIDQLWRDRRMISDVSIICQGKEIPANKVLLAARSEVFRAMFSHSMKEAQSSKVEVMDVDPHVFEQMLCYIYTGFAPDVDRYAEELLVAANKYALEELKTGCVRVLQSKLNHDNVLDMLVVADQHEAKTLKEAAFHFLVKRLDIFMDKSFKTMWYRFAEVHPALMTETVKILLERQPQSVP